MEDIKFYFNDKKVKVASYEEWESHYKLVDAYHWDKHRSAESLANYWMNQNHNDFVESLEVIGVLPIKYNDAFIEKELKFDSARGRHSMCDLCFPFIETANSSVTIAIEAKVDEQFSNVTTLEYYLNAKKTKEVNPKSTAFERIEVLHRSFAIDKTKTIEKDTDFNQLRYQLFSGFCGAIAEGNRNQANKAVFLVHVFDTPKMNSSIAKNNKDEFDKFTKYIGIARPISSGEIVKVNLEIQENPESKFRIQYHTGNLEVFIGYLQTKVF